MRDSKKGTFLLVFLILVGLVFVSSPISFAHSQQVPLLRVGTHSDESTINPYTYHFGYPGLEMVQLIYDTLLMLDTQLEVQPWLAHDYEVSEDGLTYVLFLRDDVLWNDGEKFTAHDVIFTFDYFMEYPKEVFSGPIRRMEEWEALDDYSLQLSLESPDPNFLIEPLAHVPILPQHIWEDEEDPNNADHRVGTGPFILTEYRADRHYRFEANENYWLGKPRIDRIVMPIIEDTTALLSALRGGELDTVTETLPPEQVRQFSEHPRLETVEGPGMSTTLLQINNERYPLNNEEVRRAIALAIDHQELLDTVMLGFATKGSPGFIHPASPWYNEEVKFERNVEEANRLLDEAGFGELSNNGYRLDEEGEEINLELLVYAGRPLRIRAAEIIEEYLREIKLKVNVVAMDVATVDDYVWPEFDVQEGRDYDMAMWGWASSAQRFPEQLIMLFHSDLAEARLNIGAYSNPEFDELADKLLEVIDPEEREEIIMEMQKVVAETAPIVPLYQEDVISVYNPDNYEGYEFYYGIGIVNRLSFFGYDVFEDGN